MQTTTGRNPEGFCNTIKKKKRLVSDSLNTYDELIKKYKETIHYYQTISLYSDEADRLKKEIEISIERIQTLKKWRKYEAIPCWLYLNKQQEKVCKNKK
ncbi:hypothetical protein C0583_02165 [Candidatus Parcubacteria bacterium]|nr:MAG: hypothetical protein C0583_02165 [Candidatus Parcubacteria bacterium]